MGRGRRLAIWGGTLLLVLAAAALLAREMVLRLAVVGLLRRASGCEVRVEKVSTSWLRPRVELTGVVLEPPDGDAIRVGSMSARLEAGTNVVITLRDLVVANPSGYPPGDAVRVDVFQARVDRRSLRGDPIRVLDAELSLPELSWVVDSGGRANWEAIRRGMSGDMPPAAGTPPRAGGRAPSRPARPASPAAVPRPEPESAGYVIDRVTVRVGKVRYTDLGPTRKGKAPDERSLAIDADCTLRNVTDLDAAGDELAAGLMAKAAPRLLMDEMTRSLSESADSGDLGKAAAQILADPKATEAAAKLLEQFFSAPAPSPPPPAGQR